MSQETFNARVIALNIFPNPISGDTTYEFALDTFDVVYTTDYESFVTAGWVTKEDWKRTDRYALDSRPIPVTVSRNPAGRLQFDAITPNPDQQMVFERACDDLMAYIRRSQTPGHIALRLMEQFYVL